MLFPLQYQCEVKSDVDDIGEFSGKRTPEQIQDNVHESNLEDQSVYKGPQTQICTKALMKANLLMNDCFSFLQQSWLLRGNW